MKILHILTHINIGGVALYVMNLSEGLKNEGVDCFIATSGGILGKDFESRGITIIPVNIKTKFEFNPKLIPEIFKLIKFVKEKDIDIIHSHTRVAQVVGYLVSKFTGIPLVTTWHGFFNFNKFSRKIFPCTGEGIIAISDAVKEHLIRDFKVPEEKIALIYNGVDIKNSEYMLPEEKKAALRKELGFERGCIIGSVGRLSEAKGYKYLLLAMQKVAKDIRDANLLIIGDGPLEKELMNLSKNLNIRDKVIFMKSRLDIRQYLFSMDVFVFPSVQEGLGLSLLEAMAVGRPCIATSIGGIPNIIRDGINGLLVSPRNPESLAEAIKKVILNKELSFKLGESARKTVSEKFSLEKMIEETMKFYKQLLNEKGSKSA